MGLQSKQAGKGAERACTQEEAVCNEAVTQDGLGTQNGCNIKQGNGEEWSGRWTEGKKRGREGGGGKKERLID